MMGLCNESERKGVRKERGVSLLLSMVNASNTWGHFEVARN